MISFERETLRDITYEHFTSVFSITSFHSSLYGGSVRTHTHTHINKFMHYLFVSYVSYELNIMTDSFKESVCVCVSTRSYF